MAAQMLRAPMPYFGGKRRAAPLVWERLGPVDTYIEPFCGSMAVLLNSPYGKRPREVVNDYDGLVCNFWRAIQHSPDRVAYYADYPTSHIDLTARIKYVRDHTPGMREMMQEDYVWHDAQIAGFWVWCVSNSISLNQPFGDADSSAVKLPNMTSEAGTNTRPIMNSKGGGLGVQSQRLDLDTARPHYAPHPGGQGCQAQRSDLEQSVPFLTTGQGITANTKNTMGIAFPTSRQSVPFQSPHGVAAQGKVDTEYQHMTGDRLRSWFHALSQRLSKVYITARDWSTTLSPSVMGLTGANSAKVCGIFLDPPYATATRKMLYSNDSLDIAPAVKDWAIAHAAPNVRVCVAGYIGDYSDWPEGWQAIPWGIDGIRMGGTKDVEHDRTEVLWFSPSCIIPESQTQQTLFEV